MIELAGLEKEVIHLNGEGKGFIKYHTRRAAQAEGWSIAPVLHHHTAPDHYYPHDHPFDIRVHVLSGGYTEQIYLAEGGELKEAGLRTHLRGDYFVISARRIHKIIHIIGDECWTCCLYDRSQPDRDWRFWRNFEGKRQFRIWNQEEWKDI